MRVLSDFYWTAATGAGLFTSNSATQQRHAEHCVQAARALCWERVSLTGIPVGNQSDQGNIPDAVTWACVVRTSPDLNLTPLAAFLRFLPSAARLRSAKIFTFFAERSEAALGKKRKKKQQEVSDLNQD